MNSWHTLVAGTALLCGACDGPVAPDGQVPPGEVLVPDLRTAALPNTTTTISPLNGDINPNVDANPATTTGCTCAKPAACHTCDPTDNCLVSVLPDNTACADDSNACTTDVCLSGVCTHKTTGAQCDDNNACTVSDVCNASGVCSGTTVTCTSDACTTRACNGTANCTVTPIVTCSALDQCHDVGTCDPTSGACSNPIAKDLTACTGGVCVNGKCVTSGSGGSAGASGSAGTSGGGGISSGGTGQGGSGVSGSVGQGGGGGISSAGDAGMSAGGATAGSGGSGAMSTGGLSGGGLGGEAGAVDTGG
ncbi:MAG TPA: hypothetical protein VGI10_16190, partial [Polyangiaceae bacterium]